MVRQSIFELARGAVSAKLLDRLIQAIEDGKEKDLAALFRIIAALAPSKYHRTGFEKLAFMVENDHPFVGVFKRTFRELHPNVRKKFIANFLVNFVVLGRGIRDREEKSRGFHIPNFMVISPTVRCNLHCKGCYASEYRGGEELSFEELDRILTEAKQLGMYFFTAENVSSGKTSSIYGKSTETAFSRFIRTAPFWMNRWSKSWFAWATSLPWFRSREALEAPTIGVDRGCSTGSWKPMPG